MEHFFNARPVEILQRTGEILSEVVPYLSKLFIFELQKLCDAVPSFPTKEAIEVIESELGCNVGDVFLGLEGDIPPIAAASLGQVYKVRLAQGEGRLVAAKVQRPDMHHYVLRD